MKSKTDQSDIMLSLLEKTDEYVRVLIIESLGYIRAIREIMPNADIAVVVKDDSAFDKSPYEGLGVHWIKGDYLSQLLPIEKESIDLIIGDELFLKSNLLLENVLAFCSYLSETGYLVTWFHNASYWQHVINRGNGYSHQSLSRMFNNKDILELLSNAFFQYVDFTSVTDCSAEGKSQIEQLMSVGTDVASDELAVKIWFAKVARFKPDVVALKHRYSKKTRWELIIRLLRVEHGIDAIENTVAILCLMDNEAIRPSDVAIYAFEHISNIGAFIGNFVPAFYQSGRVEMLRKLLHNMADVYQGHTDYGTVIEWVKCIDALDEYPDELLPAVQPKLYNENNNLIILPENKIAFIACINNEEYYHEWQLYINNLVVPAGMAIELIPVRGAASICQGYNIGMRQTDAKYKVYLHQDVLISNRNIIKDMLDIFTDSTIGALGVIGAQTLPPNGVWWNAHDRVGCAIQVNDPESVCKLQYSEFNGQCIDVQVVDGILIATQVDIEWREDLFSGWHFYDASQCQEMMRNGYRVVVPKQNDYWVIHCSSPKLMDYSYEQYRPVFVDEYIKNKNGKKYIFNQTLSLSNSKKETRKFLVIGNSFSIHRKCSYWWGEWGMAASKKEADYVHLIAKAISGNTPVHPDVFNFATWEIQSYDRYETLQLLDKFDFSSYEFIVVQLGENIGDATDVVDDFYELLSYIRERSSPDKRIFVYGNLWANDILDEIKEEICKLVSAEYISVKQIQSSRYISGMKRIVLGDDGSEHIIEHKGVAMHPNDEAMKFYADELIKRL